MLGSDKSSKSIPVLAMKEKELVSLQSINALFCCAWTRSGAMANRTAAHPITAKRVVRRDMVLLFVRMGLFEINRIGYYLSAKNSNLQLRA